MTKKEFALLLSLAAINSVHSQVPPGAPAAAVAPARPPAVAARGPSLEQATQAARAALEACVAQGQKVSVSVVDSAGVLKALLAGDGAHSVAVRSSIAKAVTANAFKMSTSELGEQIKTDKSLADRVAADANNVTWGGGVPIALGLETIGAIGVGGSRLATTDDTCARTGVQSIENGLK